MSRHSIAIALFLGLALIAAAVFFGLRDSEPARETQEIDPPTEHVTPWQPTTMSPKNEPRVADAFKNAEHVGRDSGVFITSWNPHQRAVRTRCRVDEYVRLNDGQWFVELPLEMRFDGGGKMTAARRFSQPRVVLHSGAATKADLSDDEIEALATCVISQITARIRLPQAQSESVLKMWVPIASSVD